MKITRKDWGMLPDGRAVSLFTLESAAGSTVTISDFGGIITSVLMPDNAGKLEDVVLGYDTLEEYIADKNYLGAMIGRYANRIAYGSFTLNGETWELTKNQKGHTLHGGSGFNKVLWTATPGEEGLLLQYHSPHGEHGFPGNMDVSILCSLSDDNRLTLDMKAVSDRDTVCSLTNHSYFNLAGQGKIFDHLFQICAEGYTPFLPTLLPDGTVQPVEGTLYDFRAPRHLTEPKLDMNFVTPGGMQRCAVVTEPVSGRTLVVSSDLPAICFYAAGGLGECLGKGGCTYGPNSGFCLEPQYYPNSPNMPEFPSCVLKKGETYHHVIHYDFQTAADA